MRGGRTRLALLVVMLSACNALTGIGDLGTGDVPCATCADGQAETSPGADSASAASDGGGDASGADALVKPDTTSNPAYCTGLVVYARFDGTLKTAQGLDGIGVGDAPPAVTYVPGKFGQAASLVGANTAVYYDSTATAPYSRAVGSIAMWIKPTWAWPPSTNRPFFKPVPNRSMGNATSSGPHLDCMVTDCGTAGSGGGMSASAAPATFTPYWKDLDWNHLVGTWRQTPALLTFTLNGGLDDAGATHLESTAAWTTDTPDLAHIRLSSPTYPADAIYDDVAIWNRLLSRDEARAVYESKISIGDACGL